MRRIQQAFAKSINSHLNKKSRKSLSSLGHCSTAVGQVRNFKLIPSESLVLISNH